MSTQHIGRDTTTSPQKNKPNSNFFTGGGNGFFPTVQTKLKVSQPADAAEREADAMADKVMRKATTGTVTQRVPGTATPVQCKCSHCEEEEKKIQRRESEEETIDLQRKCSACEAEVQQVQRKENEEEMVDLQRKCSACMAEDEELQRKEDGTDTCKSHNEVAADIKRYNGAGSPMPAEVNSYMQEQFNTDFSNVRIHDGGYAADMTTAVKAQAFTAGSDIYFNQGKYAPNDAAGQHLLAHELTHVVQQGAGAPLQVQRKEDEEMPQDKETAALTSPGKIAAPTVEFVDEPVTPDLSNAIAVHVPVDDSMIGNNSDLLKEHLLKQALLEIFPISEDQVNTMIASGWDWTWWRVVTKQEVTQGFKVVAIPRGEYQKIMGLVKPMTTTRQQQEEERQEQLTGSLETMNREAEIFRLRKALREKKKDRDALSFGAAANPYAPTPIYTEVSLEVIKLQEQLDAAYLAFGLTKDMVDRQQDEFIKGFRHSAVQLAFSWLAQNEINANVETQQYDQPANLEAFKMNVAALQKGFAESDLLLAKGLALRHGGKPESVNTLQQYIASQADVYDMPNNGERTDTSRADKEVAAERIASRLQRPENNAYLAAYHDREKSLDLQLMAVARKFPIITYPELNIRDNAGSLAIMPNDALKEKLQGFIGKAGEGGVLESIRNTWKELRMNPEKVWELPPVIEATKNNLGIAKDSGAALALEEHLEKHKSTEFWESMGMAALSVGVGLLALASGPVGWAALAGSITLGGYDAYKTYTDTRFKRDAHNTSMDPATALGTENPSYFWFVVSLAGLGLDIHSAVTTVKKLKEGAMVAEKVAAELSTHTAGQDAKQLEQVIARVTDGTYDKNLALLLPFGEDPVAMTFMLTAMKDEKLTNAFMRLAEVGGKELSLQAVHFYMAQGKHLLNEMPEVVRLMEQTNLYAHTELVQAVFMERGVQQVLLETQDGAGLLHEFSNWKKLTGADKAPTFTAHLAEAGFGVQVKKGKTITEVLGKEILKEAPEKVNRQLLSMAEPRLVAALDEGTLRPELSAVLIELLQRDMIGMLNDLEKAQGRISNQLGVMAAYVNSPEEFISVMKLLQNKAAISAFGRSLDSFMSTQPYMQLLYKIHMEQLPIPAAVWDDLLRIGTMTDEGTIIRIINETEFRKALIAHPTAARAMKKCASPCFPPEATVSQVNDIAKILDGKSREEIAKAGEYIYRHRGSGDDLEKAIKKMQENFKEAVKDINAPLDDFPEKYQSYMANIVEIQEAGVSGTQLRKIIERAAATPNYSDTQLLGQLWNVVMLERKQPTRHFATLLDALASQDEDEFRVAAAFIDQISRFVNRRKTDDGIKKYIGLEIAEFLMDIFSFKELATFSRTYVSENFLRTMYEILKRANIDGKEFMELMKLSAEGGDTTLKRIHRVLHGVRKSGDLTYEEARAAIENANKYIADLNKAAEDPVNGFEAITSRIWGESTSIDTKGEKILVDPAYARKPKPPGTPVASGKKRTVNDPDGPGTLAYTQVVGEDFSKADELAEKFFLDEKGNINLSRWTLFRDAVWGAKDVAVSIRNNIIGATWGRTMIAQVRRVHPKGEIFVEVSFTFGNVTAKADAVLLENDLLKVLEFKSMNSELSDKQQVIYDMMKQGKYAELEADAIPRLKSLLSDPDVPKVHIEIRERELIPDFDPDESVSKRIKKIIENKAK
ncbi:DUF4157 domain-containing protein [Chitinophaga sp. sic0106]|uniref:eCIS core domain-containing protein n=1 Tax=Chitinophaga sp. sic0106 TaxID=2854785 RepID=UPI001C43FEEF|nr:DUF4157 domain-containing protein [Chitinophaga sp. sic0106]MBV7530220.1 DUF4157 domain-containing protein [Chitinophaga sp. sic0106]